MDIISIRKNPKKVKTIVIVSFFIIILAVGIKSFISGSENVFFNRCDIKAKALSINIIDKVVLDNMASINYDSLLTYEKDTKENITMVKLNSVVINKLSAKISKEVQEQLSELSRNKYKNTFRCSFKD